MAKFEQVWELGRVVIRRVVEDGSPASESGRGPGGVKAGEGLVAKALASLVAPAEAPRSVPSPAQVVRMDPQAMAKALGEMAGQRVSMRLHNASGLAAGLDPVLKGCLGGRGVERLRK